MKKRIILLGIFIALSAFISTNLYADNLLDDPNFDNGINNWDFEGISFEAEGSIVFSEPYSVKSTVEDINVREYWSRLYQVFDASQGEDFYASAWVNTDITPTALARAGVTISFLDSNQDLIQGAEFSADVGGENSWRQLVVSATAPSGTHYVKFGVFLWAPEGNMASNGGVAYFDDAVLSHNYIPPPPENWLENADFENGVNGWDFDGVPFSTESSVVHGGNYAARNLITDVEDDDYWGQIYQEVDVAQGEHVFARGYARAAISPLASAKGGLMLEFFNSSGEHVGLTFKDEIGGTTEWRELKIDKAVPLTAVKARLSFYCWAPQYDTNALNGVFYCDDTSFGLEPVSMIGNGGFETGTLDGWIDFGQPAEITDQVVHSGQYGLAQSVPNIGGVYQIVDNISEGQRLYAKGWANTNLDPRFAGTAQLVLEFLDNSNVTLARFPSSKVRDNLSWTLMEVDGKAPLGTAKARVSAIALNNLMIRQPAGLSPGGFAYIDNILLEKAEDDYIFNNGFENGLNDWFEQYGEPAVVSTVSHYGVYSAKKTIPQDISERDYLSKICQDVRPLRYGQRVFSSLWVKTDISPLANASAGIMIEFLDAADEPVGQTYTEDIGGNTGWTKLELNTLSVPNGAKKVRLSGFLWAEKNDPDAPGGIAYFDDARLSK